MAQRDLKITLMGDDKTGKAFDSAGKNADGLGSKFGSIGRGVALAFGGAAVAGVAGFGAALFQGAKDAASYQQITDQLAQTIKSTGGAAGVSVDQLKTYAGQLESISGVDEELILSSQNVLATFTNIKNSVGEGNDVFNQASEAALNLSTTMGGDLQGASVLVGKALNDPIKGVTALGRAGVQLTQSQKDTIKAMVAAGDAAGAQKIILGELETQFGGAAAAAGQGLTGSIARLKDGFQDAFRTLAENLLPAITSFVTGAAAALPAIIERIKAGFDAAMPTLQAIGDAMVVVGGFVRDNLMPILAALGAVLAGALVVGVQGMITAFVAFLSPAIAVVAAVAAVAAGLVYAYQHFEGFREVVQSVVSFLTDTVGPAFVSLAETVQAKIAEAVDVVVRVWPQISEAIGHVMAVVTAVVDAALTVVTTLWSVFGDTLKTLVGAVFNFIGTTISNALDLIKGVIQTVLAVINGDWSLAWDAMKSVLSTAWDQMKNIVSLAFGVMKAALGLALDAVSALWGLAWDAMKVALSTAWDAMKTAVSTGLTAIVGFIAGLPGSAVTALSSLASSLAGVATAGFEAFRSAAATKAGEAVTFAGALPARLVSAVGNLGGLLVNAGRALMEGLAQGIGEKIEAVVGKVRDAVGLIARLLPGSPIKDGPLKGWNNGGAGLRLMDMLAGGIESGQGRVRQSMVDALDVGGMNVGGAGFVNSRLAATSSGAPVESSRGVGPADRTDELIALLTEQNALLRAMPREMRTMDRQGYARG